VAPFGDASSAAAGRASSFAAGASWLDRLFVVPSGIVVGHERLQHSSRVAHRKDELAVTAGVLAHQLRGDLGHALAVGNPSFQITERQRVEFRYALRNTRRQAAGLRGIGQPRSLLHPRQGLAAVAMLSKSGKLPRKVGIVVGYSRSLPAENVQLGDRSSQELKGLMTAKRLRLTLFPADASSARRTGVGCEVAGALAAFTRA
jgi:hypothetical protein